MLCVYACLHCPSQHSTAASKSAAPNSAVPKSAVPKSAQQCPSQHSTKQAYTPSYCSQKPLHVHSQLSLNIISKLKGAPAGCLAASAPGCLAWFTCEPCDHQSVSYNVSEERRLPNQNFCLSCEIIVYFVKKRNNKTVESRSYEMLLLPLFLAHLQDAWPEALQVVLLGMVRGAV